ncbi:MAG: iron-containing alcohol dehydrogenase [Endomicrobium sp.]|jgi:alcohol dehydrogenase class IV|nr:iron-containing alcohol dehydrogenase [Endomicrobium sp.]
MARFTLPRDLYWGRGTLAELKNLKGKKAIVVSGGSSMKKGGFLDKVDEYLKSAGFEVAHFDGVTADPTVDCVMAGAKAMQEFNPDWIIAIGGGSPIDAAKAMWVFYEYPDAKFEDIAKPFNIPPLRNKAHFCAIASTSGTATEVTAFSVITDSKIGMKYPLADTNITPDIGILDPDLVDSMPKSLAAFTGMDALTHATEAFVSTANCDFTNPLALKAIKMVYKYLLNSYTTADKKAREKMHYAQCLAGMAFSNALLGIVHSLAHKTGAFFHKDGKEFHVPHGEANAIYLPYVIKFNQKAAERRYAKIAKRLGLKGSSDAELTDAYIASIQDLNKKLSIPSSLKEYGIDEKEFKDNVSLLAERAIGDACTGSNPRQPSQKEMEQLLDAIYYGKPVNF